MATPKQIAANQRNAKQSTGPRTEEGKSVTRRNATTHGLCSKLNCTWHENQQALDALLAELKAEHQPVGPTEEIYVFQMAEQFALARRASFYLAEHTDGNQFKDLSKQVSLFLRYYTTADRAFTRNLNELRKLQKERRQQEESAGIGSVSQNVEESPESPQESIESPVPEASKQPKEPVSAQETVQEQAPAEPPAPEKTVPAPPVMDIPFSMRIEAIKKAAGDRFEIVEQAA